MEPDRPRHDSQAPLTDPTAPRRILAATDLGPVGDSTLRVAHARASATGARLAVCHVVPEASEPAENARRIAEVHDELNRLLELEREGSVG